MSMQPFVQQKELCTLFCPWYRTISNIRNDFRGRYLDTIMCPVCRLETHIDTIPNLVTCQTLTEHNKSRGLSTTLRMPAVDTSRASSPALMRGRTGTGAVARWSRWS